MYCIGMGKVLGWSGNALWTLKIAPELSSDKHVSASILDRAAYGYGIADTGRRFSVDENGAAPGGNHILVARMDDTPMRGIMVSDTTGGPTVGEHVRAPLSQRNRRAGIVAGAVIIQPCSCRHDAPSLHAVALGKATAPACQHTPGGTGGTRQPRPSGLWGAHDAAYLF